jgi:hypothetical protein
MIKLFLYKKTNNQKKYIEINKKLSSVKLPKTLLTRYRKEMIENEITLQSLYVKYLDWGCWKSSFEREKDRKRLSFLESEM